MSEPFSKFRDLDVQIKSPWTYVVDAPNKFVDGSCTSLFEISVHMILSKCVLDEIKTIQIIIDFSRLLNE
jgi:hypothetical protein